MKILQLFFNFIFVWASKYIIIRNQKPLVVSLEKIICSKLWVWCGIILFIILNSIYGQNWLLSFLVERVCLVWYSNSTDNKKKGRENNIKYYIISRMHLFAYVFNNGQTATKSVECQLNWYLDQQMIPLIS